MVGYEDGTIRIWDLKQGNPIHVLKGIRGGGVFSLALREEPEPGTGLKTSVHLLVLGTEGHQGPLTCVATNQDGSLILTGSVDCQAKLVSATTGKVSSLGFFVWTFCTSPVFSLFVQVCESLFLPVGGGCVQT